MKRWAWLVVGLYLATLLFLTAPVAFLSGFDWFAQENQSTSLFSRFTLSWSDALEIYQDWGYYIWLVLMVSAQAILLLVPMDASRKRLKARRSLLVPIWTTALLLACLCGLGLFDLACAFLGDEAFELFYEPAGPASSMVPHVPFLGALFGAAGFTANQDTVTILFMIATLLILWMVWGMIFYRHARDDDGPAFQHRAVTWLLRGSILEFLIAVPAHIIVRHRQDCCAPHATFVGLTMGLAIMLLAFGPGVLFLLQKRIQERSLRRGAKN